MVPVLLVLCLQAYLRLTGADRGEINSVTDLETQCSSSVMQITVHFSAPFHGLLHARGFPSECLVQGTGLRSLTLSLPTSSCGVRLTQDLHFQAAVDIQFDGKLQLALDERRLASCVAPLEDNEIFTEAAPPGTPHHQALRSSSREMEFEPARAWMELEASGGKGVALVGEPVRLRVRTKGIDGLKMRITDCVAHEGAGESPQKLLDELGCPIEPQVLGHFNYTKQGALAIFPAFKFPDRESLHLQCVLMLCRDACPVGRCRDNTMAASGGVHSQVVRKIKVFNSLRVAAPGIEMEANEVADFQRQDDVEVEKLERNFCLSAPKLALALALLGLLLVLAVGVALFSATASRRKPYVRVIY
ncbi:uncharacterized protein LOC132197063 [Neocloeon triangulifer]|uniref:uncharacterized protein LOC132197063 n=1 Tax=Neocloeon triangulifer TaxID=2078957 RepID=UPI00286F6662|nr:uncharacterized protein LOC132197063 [Neocloeon triangulifer]